MNREKLVELGASPSDWEGFEGRELELAPKMEVVALSRAGLLAYNFRLHPIL